MEVIRDILSDSVSNGFWNFMGYWIIISSIFQTPLIILNKVLRHVSIKDTDENFKNGK